MQGERAAPVERGTTCAILRKFRDGAAAESRVARCRAVRFELKINRAWGAET
jgi:hypothetical protein